MIHSLIRSKNIKRLASVAASERGFRAIATVDYGK